MAIIKQLHEITLRDVILLDATKKADSLKKYRFIPLWLCRNQIEKLCREIFDLIGNSTVQNLEDEFDKLLSIRKIQILEALYKAVQIEVGLKAKINAWKILINKDIRESQTLEKVLYEIKKHTGIEINTPIDLKVFADHIEWKIAKHREMFPEVEKQEGVKLSKVIYSVFNFLSEPFNENISLIMFCEMKQLAEERIKSQKPKEDEQF